jgi:transposase-like protein
MWLLLGFGVVGLYGQRWGDERLRMGLPASIGAAHAAPVNLSSLIDDAKCYELVRQHRWPDGVRYPHYESAAVARHGRNDTQPHRQRYRCKRCAGRFDDLTGTVLAGHHQPLRVWVLCLYFMGLNLSNRQIAQELDLSQSDVQQRMTEQLRGGRKARSKLKASLRSTDAAREAVSRSSSHKRRITPAAFSCPGIGAPLGPNLPDRHLCRRRPLFRRRPSTSERPDQPCRGGGSHA